MTTVPSLPALYFAQVGGQSLKAQAEESSTELPAELLHHCLAAYADWGDLAKLACVQKSWSNVLKDAANQSTKAKWQLAQALLHGTAGLLVNYELALQLLHELANVPVDEHRAPLVDSIDSEAQCHALAMKEIASCYLEGRGVEPDAQVGVAWLQGAFSHGHDIDAAHDVALIYEYGTFDVETDVVKAAEWFERAAQAGHLEAMAELGLCYELGCGVEPNDEVALEWYYKAAEKGHLTAQYSVAQAFEEARGVPQSDTEACLWYYRAAVEGDVDSHRALRRLESIARIVLPGVAALLDG